MPEVCIQNGICSKLNVVFMASVCLTKTWLDENIPDSDLSIHRNRHGGGIALYTSTDFAFKVIFLLITVFNVS